MYNEKLWLYTKTKEIFQQIKSFRTLIYYGKLWYFVNCKLEKKNYGSMEKKLWYYGKTMVLHQKLWNFDLPWYHSNLYYYILYVTVVFLLGFFCMNLWIVYENISCIKFVRKAKF